MDGHPDIETDGAAAGAGLSTPRIAATTSGGTISGWIPLCLGAPIAISRRASMTLGNLSLPCDADSSRLQAVSAPTSTATTPSMRITAYDRFRQGLAVGKLTALSFCRRPVTHRAARGLWALDERFCVTLRYRNADEFRDRRPQRLGQALQQLDGRVFEASFEPAQIRSGHRGIHGKSLLRYASPET